MLGWQRHAPRGWSHWSGSGTLAIAAIVGVLATIAIIQRTAMASTTQETCANTSGIACGNQGFPPGPMSICSSNQVGAACNACNGTTGYRYCSSSAQSRVCTPPKPVPVCGKPFTGVCTKATYLVYTYYYCPTTTAGGTQSCSVSSACTADAPRPKG